MRMRVKKWARPELSVCPFYVAEPGEMRGKWREAFKKDQPLHIELGCGKGVSTCQMALSEDSNNFVAVDLITSVLGVAKRNAESAYKGVREIDNLILCNFDIEYIDSFFASEDSVERIYISFCNPWNQRPKQAKHRLTHPRQLLKYREIMKDGGEIYFKTDDDKLFKDSVGYFESCGFDIKFITYDLHESGFTPNYETEHEKMFTNEGVKIKFLIAEKRSGFETTADAALDADEE
ncbi:MAG: tRNA (guanosine(46)-N7)-methyltransferase TrmB [Clostridia bacterium]|nr:tRNA (guanosine(46)-N7)-methyltransferase TrmB [Clostridia bacterium]